MSTITEPQVRLIASSRAWIEGEALRQFCATAKLGDVRLAVGFPDLQPGKGTPVGAAFVTEDVIYPHLIGSDIGCGMALFKAGLSRSDTRHLDEWAVLRFDLEHPWHGCVSDVLDDQGLDACGFDAALGTLGGGNHFAELQAVEKIQDAGAFRRLGLGSDQLIVFVHSGSRGIGDAVLRDYTNEHGANRAPVDSPAAEKYFRGHDFAALWARANRALIAKRFAAALGTEVERVWDGCHNGIERRVGVSPAPAASTDERPYGPARQWKCVHRKGAVIADGEFVVIAGSRGSLSYLVRPIGDGERHAWSLAHGAGRKWSRSTGRARMRERFSVSELVQTPLGGRVICEQRDLLYEEAPAAYKDIGTVVQDLVDAELVSVVATFRPLLTYKTRRLRR